ncbi:family 16 glycosylhydrolase [Patescibacteria group bacterium]|nr:family 16 glycosylhydrolase [Patescibacteria group bacterium]MBU1672846.1 family 16 glycosylhydrolase [Patescibacteria group bacterium]MBU1963733.1 family 16 glycosylhydrolase [Patescibacteria group bacterium]
MKKYFIFFIIIPFLLAGCSSNNPAIIASDDYGWVLIWEDNFNSENYDMWEKANHTFAKNLARFNPENAIIDDGILRLKLTGEPQASRDYSGAEYRSRENYSFGRYETRMKVAKGDGIITAFFTYEDDQNGLNEIDVEFRGNNTNEIHFNNWTSIKDENSEIIKLNFDASEAFHDYIIEWQPGHIKWYVDGEMLYETKKDIPQGDQRVIMNIWISDDKSKTGLLNEDELPTEAKFDYVKFYTK